MLQIVTGLNYSTESAENTAFFRYTGSGKIP